MKTEIIKSSKIVGDFVVVTTESGNTVWVPKAQFDAGAETITYEPLKAGTEYTKKDGSVAQLKKDRNNFVGLGKQTVQKFSAMQILDHLIGKGVTPAFNLG